MVGWAAKRPSKPLVISKAWSVEQPRRSSSRESGVSRPRPTRKPPAPNQKTSIPKEQQMSKQHKRHFGRLAAALAASSVLFFGSAAPAMASSTGELTLTVAAGSGTVEKTDLGNGTYALTATPATGYTFAGWMGGSTATRTAANTTSQVTVGTYNVNLFALFTQEREVPPPPEPEIIRVPGPVQTVRDPDVYLPGTVAVIPAPGGTTTVIEGGTSVGDSGGAGAGTGGGAGGASGDAASDTTAADTAIESVGDADSGTDDAEVPELAITGEGDTGGAGNADLSATDDEAPALAITGESDDELVDAAEQPASVNSPAAVWIAGSTLALLAIGGTIASRQHARNRTA